MAAANNDWKKYTTPEALMQFQQEMGFFNPAPPIAPQAKKTTTALITKPVTPAPAPTPIAAAAPAPTPLPQLPAASPASNGYAPSEAVLNYQKMLNDINQQQPGAYESQYKDQMTGLYDQISNRGKFQYDLNGDMLYQQLKDRYMQQGNQAMMDTMGQANAATGGYGNSYSQTAGQQQYGQYMQALNDKVPELYDRAQGKWQMEGDELYRQYGLNQQADQIDYSQYRDTVGDWQNNRGFTADMYQNERGFDFGAYTDQRNFDQSENQFNTNKAYDTVMTLLQKGGMPSNEMLSAAGLDYGTAQGLAKAYTPAPAASRSSSSSKPAALKNISAAQWNAGVSAYEKGGEDGLTRYIMGLEAQGVSAGDAERYYQQFKTAGVANKSQTGSTGGPKTNEDLIADANAYLELLKKK